MKSNRSLAAAIVAAAAVSAAWLGQPSFGAEHALSQEQATEVRRIVRDYLLTNPSVILEAIEILRTREEAGAADRARQAVASRRAELLEDPGSPVGGNRNGDVTIVEFFDYRCPYCKQVHPTIKTLLQEDGNIRFVYKEWPILGPASVFAARAALAARGQDKYLQFHGALMEIRGALDESSVFNAAKSAGLDVDRLKRDMKAQSAETDAIFARITDLARDLGISGTPAFVIGDAVIRGAADANMLRAAIAEARRRIK